MGFFRLLLLALALPVLLMGSGCSDAEPYVLPPVDEPSFSYDLYCDAHGNLVGRGTDLLLTRRPSHLERVYADAQHGQPRAQRLFQQLEAIFRLSGMRVADKATSLPCLASPVPCKPEWGFLDGLLASNGPGAMHLRQALADSFALRARQRNMENTLILASLNVLLAGTLMKQTLAGATANAEANVATAESRTTVTAEGRAAASAEVQANAEALAGKTLVASEAEVLQARLLEAEAVAPGPRHPAALPQLARFRPSLAGPPAGTATSAPLWSDYVSYWETRYTTLAGQRTGPPGQTALKPPLTWESYQAFRAHVQRGFAFQRQVSEAMQRELALPEPQRSLLRGMQQPLVMDNVGLAHPGTPSLTYADQFVVDAATLRPGATPRVHTFSNKSRNFSMMNDEQIQQQATADATEALSKYGNTLEVRRPGHPLFGKKTVVTRVHLVYDAQMAVGEPQRFIFNALKSTGVEVHFHAP
jgi:hypothetical protein